ncbi:pyruvate/2-oxoglutarate dehydrogenase complex dihydrolipoamide dehydrogenase (E3) component [gamma proteobacterium BDW918]|uniref:Pyridine nucleotide-disulfide oxidoreductase n=1 Tax=Zhongshania aliphaticivorans TaxID=1470434 RepID=A0A127M7L1_9GAMM|nr:bifunctional TVP38/TMEM64 family protein/FAD-dependent oxidoreductase [Zhongshania aliphaticivorans]AMO69191.1 pyridine nucleotide-disulfide oxidoreductase [Zhongshania aliphaticivorans]EIF43841.1 pyruvate/2-oxoglutarate dehydrogenase complex dihydrolipoamide dehydrogenase (E3) component [gamma proteobacterium BDW918]
MKTRIALLALLIIAVAGFFIADLDHYFSLAGARALQGEVLVWRTEQPILLAAIMFVVYVAIAALSLPGAAVMTLLVGASFGLGWGLLIVSFASSVGATLAFLMTRYILRDSVQARFGERLQTINAGVERDGMFYLFSLRLVPVFPFFLINMLMGLTPLKTRQFYWVSQLGMLPGTVIFVNAGSQLSELNSLSGILSPALLASFVLLGIFPFIAKWLLAVIKARRVYAGWQRPAKFDRNLIVIGGGAAGLVSAYIGAAVKAKVTLIEAHKMGGDCLNYGCVPSKALIKTAKVLNQQRHGEAYGLDGSAATFDFRKVMARIKAVIAQIEPHDSIARYTDLGVEVIEGYAKLLDPWTVEITLNSGGTQRLTARAIIIAAGAQPAVPPLPGLDDVDYLTSDTLWDALADQPEAPRRLVVLGGGPIGCELAQAFARLGSAVTQVEMLPRVMMREDEEVASAVTESLSADGVIVLTNTKALRCEQSGGLKQLIVLNAHGEEEAIVFDTLICAVGRSARLTGYGLETLGIDTARTVKTNDYLETIYPNILAAGDVAGPYQFTHVAAHQAWYAAVNGLFGGFKKFKADYSVIPWVTYVDPEVARVGLSEAEATEQGIAYEVSRYGIDDLDRAICDSHAVGFIKVLTVPGKDTILGVCIMGAQAGELLAEYVLAMKHGLGLKKILGTIHSYPSMAEANKYVAGEWQKSHAPEWAYKYLVAFHRWRRG